MGAFFGFLIFCFAVYGLVTLVCKVITFVKRCLYIRKLKRKGTQAEVSSDVSLDRSALESYVESMINSALKGEKK